MMSQNRKHLMSRKKIRLSNFYVYTIIEDCYTPMQQSSLFLSIFYALAFELIVSITFLIPIQTFISVNISTTLP